MSKCLKEPYGFELGIGSCWPPNTISQILFYDTFTGENGTALSAHTPDTDIRGNGWDDINGGLEIQSNKATAAAGASYKYSVVDAEESDVEIEVDFTAGSYDWVPVRYVDEDNQWLVQARGANTEWRLYKIDGGDTTQMDNGGTVAVGNTYAVKIVCSGNSINVYVDDELTLSTSNAFNASATKHGIMRASTGTASVFDNFKITG